MPQNPLPLNPDPPDCTLVLEIRDLTVDLVDALQVTVRLARVDRPPETFAVIDLAGRGADCLSTVVQALAATWAHGTRADLLRTIQQQRREVRRHRARHDLI